MQRSDGTPLASGRHRVQGADVPGGSPGSFPQPVRGRPKGYNIEVATRDHPLNQFDLVGQHDRDQLSRIFVQYVNATPSKILPVAADEKPTL